jgi:hypothetical protein
MSQISKLTTTVRTTEINSVANGILAEFSASNLSSDAHLTTILGLLQPINANLTEAINRIKAESNLEEKDELRDGKIKAINYLAMGFVYHPDLAISSAAKIISAVFEHYGTNIVNESYAIESSLIGSLLLEFSKAELQASIALLPGLSQIIDELRVAQAEFDQAQLAFQNEKANDGVKTSATDIKKEVLAIINEKLVVYLLAMQMVDEAKYGEFVRVVAQIINDMNVTIKKRKKTTVIENTEVN